MTPIRVLIADDDPLVRHALRLFLDGSADLRVVGEAHNGEVALAEIARLSPDVVVMDLRMPVLSGIAATARIVREFPATRVLAVTTFSTERYAVPALRAGAAGCLLKDAEPAELRAAIREAAAGRSAVSPEVARDLVASLRGGARSPAPDGTARELPLGTSSHGADRARTNPGRGPHGLAAAEALTDRERSIVEQIARGMSNAEIARTLHLSEPTVKANLTRIMRKWGVRDRVQVLITAIVTGCVDPDALDPAAPERPDPGR